MKKTINLFNFLTLGVFLSVVILFIGNLFGFSLDINFNFLFRILTGFLALTLMINFKNIKDILGSSTILKKFLLLTGINLFLFVLFLLFYPLFSFGSPLVFEDRIANFKASQKEEIVLGQPIRQNFLAKSNNLGTIGLKIINKDIVVDEGTEEIDEEEKLNGELFSEKPDKIIFRIKEEKGNSSDLTANVEKSSLLFGLPFQEKSKEGNYIFDKKVSSDDYLYKNTYELTTDFQTSYFLFGFPIQKESKDKSYVFEIEKIEEGETGKTFLLEKNADGNFNFYPRYVYSLKELKSNYQPILSNISRKTNQFLEEKINQINLIIVFLLFEIFFFCFLKKEEKYFKEKINPCFKYSFLFVLFFAALSSLIIYPIENFNTYLKGVVEHLSIYNLPLVIFTIGFGFLAFYFNKEEIEKDLEEEKEKEELTEEKRFEEFRVGRSARWCHKKNWLYLIGLVLIITMFTAIKAPYFNITFSGMKYNSYVGPAKYMYEHHNPFWSQKKYSVDPIDNPQGIFKSFGTLPIIEWGLFLTYKLFPGNSIEFNTRIFTNFLGILILIFAYLFFSKWLTKKQSLLVTFLMALNPIINYSSFKTIEDSLLLIFMFISLNYLSVYFNSRDIRYLFFSGLFFGIGNSCKYSLFLWLAPISIILMFFYKKKSLLKDIAILIILSLIPTIVFKTSLRYLPTNAILSIVKFLAWVAFFILIYYLLKKYNEKLEKFDSFLTSKKFLLFISIVILTLIGVVFLYYTGLYKFSNEFLTDSKLIFNKAMYNFMLNTQFKSYMTNIVFYLGLIGFIFSLLFGLKKQRILLLSFFSGVMIYWVLASKVIFFHNYYANIIMITFCLSIGIMIYLIGKSFKNKFLSIILLLFIGIIIFPPSYNAVIVILDKEKNQYVGQAAQYLIENTKENEIYIDAGNNQYLTILSNRAQTRDFLLDSPEIKNSIKEIGFSEAMKKYNISYIVTTKNTPEYERYVNLFADEELKSISYKRTDIILSKIENEYEELPDLEIRNELIEKYNLKDKFFLENQIGPYKFFKFVD